MIVYIPCMPAFFSMRLVRNLLALCITALFTFLIFRGVAAFNDVLKMFNALPVEQRLACPEGLKRIKSEKTGIQECIPAPSDTKGVVPVGLYLRDKPPPAAAAPSPPPSARPSSASPPAAANPSADAPPKP